LYAAADGCLLLLLFLLICVNLQTVRVWKGTIREYKAHLAKKMGVVH
jgi:hypothetical protein